MGWKGIGHNAKKTIQFLFGSVGRVVTMAITSRSGPAGVLLKLGFSVHEPIDIIHRVGEVYLELACRVPIYLVQTHLFPGKQQNLKTRGLEGRNQKTNVIRPRDGEQHVDVVRNCHGDNRCVVIDVDAKSVLLMLPETVIREQFSGVSELGLTVSGLPSGPLQLIINLTDQVLESYPVLAGVWTFDNGGQEKGDQRLASSGG
jgi:hypothetical protein